MAPINSANSGCISRAQPPTQWDEVQLLIPVTAQPAKRGLPASRSTAAMESERYLILQTRLRRLSDRRCRPSLWRSMLIMLSNTSIRPDLGRVFYEHDCRSC